MAAVVVRLTVAPSARKGKSGVASLMSSKSDDRLNEICSTKRAPRLAGPAGIRHIEVYESLASAGRRLAAHRRSGPDQYGQDSSGGRADARTCLGHDRAA